MSRLIITVLGVVAIGVGGVTAGHAEPEPPADTVECLPAAGLSAELGADYVCVVRHADGSEEILRA